MKALLLAILVVMALADTRDIQRMRITVGERRLMANGSSAYEIDCVGANGPVSYQVDGLP